MVDTTCPLVYLIVPSGVTISSCATNLKLTPSRPLSSNTGVFNLPYSVFLSSILVNCSANFSISTTAFCESLYVTDAHPFYVRTRYKEWNNERRVYTRKFSEPEWKIAKELNRDCFVGTAINKENIIPILNNNLDTYLQENNFWHLIGRYIGDGWIKNKNRKSRRQKLVVCIISTNVFNK